MIERARRGDRNMPATEFRIARLDGAVRRLRATAAFEDPAEHGPRWLVGSFHDVTDQRDAERQLAAHAAVTAAFAAWDTFESGTRRLLRGVASALGFEVGTLWVPQDDVLRPRVTWSAPAVDVPTFRRAALDSRLPVGADLPGLAWKLRRPVQRVAASGRDWAAHARAAAADGLLAAVAIPALSGDELVAVMELHSTHDATLGESLMTSLGRIGTSVGEFFDRVPGELEPIGLSPRELQVLQLAANGLTGPDIAARLVLSPATVKTHFEHAYQKLGVSDRAGAVARALRAGLIE
jgi:DNA-binding NarL/FixJ family response regulator